ncbi:hypothetical protein C8R47DRAFT_1080474 [Mycena vitilis]|nr:hypothetical protein C8R47DRAFT_1080474 [Mycena vitilis]
MRIEWRRRGGVASGGHQNPMISHLRRIPPSLPAPQIRHAHRMAAARRRRVGWASKSDDFTPTKDVTQPSRTANPTCAPKNGGAAASTPGRIKTRSFHTSSPAYPLHKPDRRAQRRQHGGSAESGGSSKSTLPVTALTSKPLAAHIVVDVHATYCRRGGIVSAA